MALSLGEDCAKGLEVTKIVKEIGGFCVKLEAKKFFQIQSFTKYLRLTLVFL